MKRFIALFVLTIAVNAFADPVSIRVKSGLLQRPDDSIVEVDSGLYLNDDGAAAVRAYVLGLETKNDELTGALRRANQKISESSAYIPGIPVWVTVTLGVLLSAASIAVGVFAAKEAGAFK